ncbi:hypothetical protein PGT21_023371 [Puccinia graminis f. sp. tritici]|uniref:Uncharacterized protein n=1 Tax=Puccinia graminis f. sp. tritici TaxID=56615 RepID=A0A5B0M7C9_PUCGR|nr:hypothetical protein PGTUg99_018597 [Puccinia graminis f. sp. tritici]KAA1071938.1 hypothetical protein PGT21_023371 [Puccinia graminis f. sp. tritici]
MTINHRKTTSTSTTTYYHSTTTTTIHHQRRATHQQEHQPAWTSTALHSSLIRPHPSHQTLTRPLTPLLTLAAYGSLIITALSALIGLILASYGLSAWDDAKDRLTGVRALIGKGRLLVGKHFVTPTAFLQSSVEPTNHTTIPRRAAPEWRYSTPDGLLDSSMNSTTGYEVHPKEEDDEDEDTKLKDWDEQETTKPSTDPAPSPPTSLPPRPPISVLIASLFLTLIVLSARLLVVWWMGQQAQKNSSLAFRNAQRAFEAANDDHQLPPIQIHPLNHHHHHRPHSSSTPPHPSSPNRLPKSSSSSSIASNHSLSQDL